MIKTKKESPEVLYSLNKYTTLNKKDLLTLQQKGLRNKKRIIRLCIHKSKKDLVHEMFIVFPKSYYCKPHKHTTEESMSVIMGRADVILFKNNGEIFKIIANEPEKFYENPDLMMPILKELADKNTTFTQAIKIIKGLLKTLKN